jgi:hypothetical protein
MATVYIPSTGQRSIHLILEPYTLAMLPMGHLTSRIDPFDQYCTGNCVLNESYRPVINVGVWAYQLNTYLGLIQPHFGSEIMMLVHEHLLYALDGIGGAELKIGQTMELIMAALSTSEITVSADSGEVDVPIEMNVALLLLLDTPQSPDYVSEPTRRMERIGTISMDVDWCFAEILIRSREDITDTFLPILETTNLIQHSIRGLQGVGAH